jgi:putative acetyltransferase
VVQIREARTKNLLSSARDLIMEYSASLGLDLSFQNFEQEMAEFPLHYTRPDGRILVAVEGGEAVGVVGLRRFSGSICELKRMYVRPGFRGRGIGRLLAARAIEEARAIGYARMRLDTLSRLKEAVSLYDSLGFEVIGPYRANPNKGVIYMELDLGSPRPRAPPRDRARERGRTSV